MVPHVERMENDNFAKKFSVRECADICSMGKPKKRWIDTMNVRKARRMVHDRI